MAWTACHDERPVQLKVDLSLCETLPWRNWATLRSIHIRNCNKVSKYYRVCACRINLLSFFRRFIHPEHKLAKYTREYLIYNIYVMLRYSEGSLFRRLLIPKKEIRFTILKVGIPHESKTNTAFYDIFGNMIIRNNKAYFIFFFTILISSSKLRPFQFLTFGVTNL